MKDKHYINLSNGIQAISEYQLSEYTFMRIQSTACEQNLMSQILQSVPDDLLMNLALNDTMCHIYDYGSRNGSIPRAFWLGLEWVKYVLYRIWFKEEYMPTKGKSQQKYFREEYRKLHQRDRNRVKYFVKWIPQENTKGLLIKIHCGKAPFDGKYTYLKNTLCGERND